ncbi:MAG: EamA family transporter [Rhodocyclaceae bacterium]|nr:EamA family transporter [Rhodocyclaceae bacterium]
MPRLGDYTYIAATIAFTVYGQLILKWRVGHFGELPQDGVAKIGHLFRLLLDPAILSGVAAAFAASLCWMAAMTRFQLSEAYPFMALNFVIVILLSAWLLAEPVSLQRAFGVALIVLGTVVAARG